MIDTTDLDARFAAHKVHAQRTNRDGWIKGTLAAERQAGSVGDRERIGRIVHFSCLVGHLRIATFKAWRKLSTPTPEPNQLPMDG